MQKTFYKIEEGKLQIGSGELIPESFIEYEVGAESQELLDVLESEEQEQELQSKIQEAKMFLDRTDKKVLPDYVFREDDNTLEWYIAERVKAREFIRANS